MSQIVGKTSTCETIASEAPRPICGWRMNSAMPVPASVRVHFISGKETPWSVV